MEESSYLELIDEISEVFIKQDKLLGTFIDLPKTFDIVDHETISNKFCFYGINDKNIDWFKTNLSNIKQYIDYDNRKEKSNLLKIACSVPQRSILGPLFFVIYIYDLRNIPKILNSIKLRMI